MSHHHAGTAARVKAAVDVNMHTLALGGCTPIPLASYLKALGILRLVAEQADPDVRGWWQEERFHVRSRLSKDDLMNFFLHEYEPTPIISPWSGRAGFLEGETGGVPSTRKGARILREIESSAAERLQNYRILVQQARTNDTLAEMDGIKAEQNRLKEERKRPGLTAAERTNIDEQMKALAAREKPLKDVLLASLRADLLEQTVDWIDTCFAIADDIRAGALLGTGGNEGSMDFSINHLETLLLMFDKETGEPQAGLGAALDGALTGESVQQWNGVNPGLLAPGSLGGPNMGSGFEGALHENPWDAVLMLEGALLFSATVTRRHGASPGGGLSFPFALGAVNAGHGGVSREETARPEIWAPLWEMPATLDELDALFAEGRITVGRRPARNALDAARAVSKLGADRGISQFQRFGFYERRGQGYYVTVPLERRRASPRPAARLIDDLEKYGWLTNFRRLASARGTPARLVSLIRAVEDGIFRVTGARDDASAVQALLVALGAAQLYLADSPQAREACPPLPLLSSKWAELADDRTAEYRIALSLTGLHGYSAPAAGQFAPTLPLAVHFAPLEITGVIPVAVDPGTRESEGPDDLRGGAASVRRTPWNQAWDNTSRATNRVVWGPGSLESNLIAIMQRRMVEEKTLKLQDKPFEPWSAAPLDEVAAWLRGGLDSRKIARLLPGLSVTTAKYGAERWFEGSERRDVTSLLPIAYALLKPLFCSNKQLRRTRLIADDVSLPLPLEVVIHLRAGRVEAAMRIALRRLRILGLASRLPDVSAAGVHPERLAAALLAPIRDDALKALGRVLGAGKKTRTDNSSTRQSEE